MNFVKNYFQFELAIYFIVWLCAVLYSIFRFTTDANKYFQSYNDEYSDFSPGWTFLARKQDSADYEWRTIKFLIEKLSIWVILSIALSEIFRKFKAIKYRRLFQLLQIWQVSITTIFIIIELGLFPLLVILVQPLIFALAFTWRSKLAIWFGNGLALLLISLYKNFIGYEEFFLLFKMNVLTVYVTILGVFWMNLKCVSYFLDLLSACNDSRQNVLEFLSYCLYLPTAFCGPFIPFKDFKNCYQTQKELIDRLSSLFLQICRFTFWLFFADFFLHFIYVNAAGFHPQWVKNLNFWSLYGYGYTMGQFFHIKYLVIYGLSTSLAKFENVAVPSLPVCIGRIHLYSDMWRYFDAGLYNFLVRYIYIPFRKSGIKQSRLLGSLSCFVFVYVWHGTDDYILIWSLMNYIAVLLENFGEWLNNRHLKNTKFIQKMGPLWFRRISCMIASPLLAFSAISNFYFFARTDIGNIFLMRFLNGNLLTNVGTLAILYCCCQVSTELRLRRAIAQQVNKNK